MSILEELVKELEPLERPFNFMSFVPEPTISFPNSPPMSLRMNSRPKPLTLLEKLEIYHESNCSRKQRF